MTRHIDPGASCRRTRLLDVRVRQGEPIPPEDVTPFEHYLTARWSLFGVRRHRLTFARASHERWPLRRAHVLSWSTTLFEPAGIPVPTSEPIVLSSHGVSVEIGARRVPDLERTLFRLCLGVEVDPSDPVDRHARHQHDRDRPLTEYPCSQRCQDRHCDEGHANAIERSVHTSDRTQFSLLSNRYLVQNYR